MRNSVRGFASQISQSERDIQHLIIRGSPQSMKASIFFVSINETESCAFEVNTRTSVVSRCVRLHQYIRVSKSSWLNKLTAAYMACVSNHSLLLSSMQNIRLKQA